MAERPQLPSSSDRASAMAARFGMTREAVEELLHQTHAEYPAALPEGSSLPATVPAEETPIEQAAKKLSGNAESFPSPPVAHQGAKPLSGGFIAAIFIVLIIALGIALSFRQGCFERRIGRKAVKPVDTIQTMMSSAARQASSPPRPATNVAPGEVPPEALAVPREKSSSASGLSSNSGITTEAPSDHLTSKKPVFVTSSNFEAEEELALLHAGGKPHAYMKTTRTHSGVRYRVFSK